MSAKRDRTSAERERASAKRERAKARAGSYHTRPENQANDFEKVYVVGCSMIMIIFGPVRMDPATLKKD